MIHRTISRRAERWSKRILRKMLLSSPVTSFINYTKNTALPGFDKLPIYDVADFFFTGIHRGSIVTRAQSLAFSFFTAIFPSIIFLFSIIPYIPIHQFQNDLMGLVQNILPKNAYESARATIEDIVRIQHGGLLSVGFVMAFYFTTNGFMTMMKQFNSSYHVSETRSPLKQRFVALLLTLILSVLIIISVVAIVFSEYAIKFLVKSSILKTKTQVMLLLLGKWTVVLALFFFTISLLYYYTPSVRKRWRFISAGSTFATLLSILVSTGFAFFVNHFGQYNKIYGSIGTLIVIMLWIYFNSFILLLGFELNASIENARNKVKRVF